MTELSRRGYGRAEARAQKEPVNIPVYDGYTVLILLC